jgi:hypothetical protein
VGRRILCLSLTFSALLGSAFGGEQPVAYTTGTHSDVQSAVREASDSDTLLFPQSTFIFNQEGRTNKSLGLWGVESTDSGPMTVLEKSESAHCRFFSFSGDGGSGVSSITGANVLPGYKFVVRREDDRLLADFLGYFGDLGAASISHKSLSEG